MNDRSASTGDADEVAFAPADLRDYQQGDILELESIPLLGHDGEPVSHETPDGVAILTQTCDVVQEDKHSIHVAPLVELPEDKAKGAAKGAMPSYVAVTEAGPQVFADLEHIATVDKQRVASLTPRRGMATVDEQKRFGARVGRKFSRFAFPDEVSFWLEPLKKIVLSKIDKGNSALGIVLNESVESLRLECTSKWGAGAPYQLTLVVIVRVPELDEVDLGSLAPMPEDLRTWLYRSDGSILRSPAELAERLLAEDDVDPMRRAWLWDAFAEALAGVCVPQPLRIPEQDRERTLSAVTEKRLDWEVTTIREFTYERYLSSEDIDVDHLSPPLPR